MGTDRTNVEGVAIEDAFEIEEAGVPQPVPIPGGAFSPLIGVYNW